MLPRLLFVLLLLCTSVPAQAQRPLALDGSETSVTLGRHLGLLRDAEGRLDFETVSGPASAFAPLAPGDEANFGYVDGAVRLRLQLRSAMAGRSDWRLELDYASLDHADLFERLPNGSIRRLHTGDRVPFPQRAVPHRNPVFALQLAPDESARCICAYSRTAT